MDCNTSSTVEHQVLWFDWWSCNNSLYIICSGLSDCNPSRRHQNLINNSIMEIIFPFVVIKWNLITRHQFPLDPKVSIVSKWDFILHNMDPYNNGMQIHHISKILSTCQFELPMRNFPFFIAWILHVKIWGVHDIIRMELSYFNITSRACMGYILTGWFSSICINKTHVYQEEVEVGVI